MIYCSKCGASLEERIPAGDDRLRKVCLGCGAIHYENPIAVVGCVVEEAGRVLLCRRAIEPAHGLWTVPAGFLELGESAVAGAIRETREEACADVEVWAPQSYIDLPHIGQSYALFRARLRSGEYGAGKESLEVELFEEERIPWSELAFPVIRTALQLWIEDRRRGVAHLHLGLLRWNGVGSRFDVASYALEEHLRVPLVVPRMPKP